MAYCHRACKNTLKINLYIRKDFDQQADVSLCCAVFKYTPAK